MCSDGKQCIGSSKMCNAGPDCGENKCVDCADGSDEDADRCKNFVCLKGSHYKCADGVQCIRKTWKCDGWEDCKDGSDEKGCPGSG